MSAEPPKSVFKWEQIDCSAAPVLLGATLACGQSFRWQCDSAGTWWGVVGAQAVALWQAAGSPEHTLFWQTFPAQGNEALVRDYLRLQVDVDSLAAAWVKAEPAIADATTVLRGLRILRQPPEECLFAFQCATCNTVVKIERSIRALARRYGERIAAPGSPFELYRFPTAERLATAEDAALRSDMWGFRAPRVIDIARRLSDMPECWLASLRRQPLAECRIALKQFSGIGTKLADCIALFSLDKDEAVPVDTHVRQIACRLFVPELRQKSLTDRVYEEISRAYRDRFGAYAGWAQQYLFFGELRRAQEYGAGER